MKPVEVRSELADALKLDLVGPSEQLGSPQEVLPQAPSRWYLTGFLVPLDADQSRRRCGQRRGSRCRQRRRWSRRRDVAGTRVRPPKLPAVFDRFKLAGFQRNAQAEGPCPLG